MIIGSSGGQEARGRRSTEAWEACRQGVEKEEEQKNLTHAWRQKLWHGEAMPARP
jgi:hypothetical protein